MPAYYQLLGREQDEQGITTAHYRSTLHSQGAWNAHEQHMAPATGIMCTELEQFMPRTDMRIGRISLDIWGLIAFGEFSIQTRLLRPGKTIELIESTMQAQGKTCIVARAWRMMTQNSSEISGLEDDKVAHPEKLPVWTGMQSWPGGFIQTLEARADERRRSGKGIVWLHNDTHMVEGCNTTDFVRLMGMVDTANGVVPRDQTSEAKWAFPNLDLQIHLYRWPQGQWLGLEVVQQYGHDGIGLTSSILHDVHGPFGRSEQILTLRKMDA
ncbi:thioesterase family protein [Acinetobacter sp. ANC 5502]